MINKERKKMKQKHLYRTVSLLGFGRSQNRIPTEDFIIAANMAAESINALAPLMGRMEYKLSDAEVGAATGEDGFLRFDASGYFGELDSSEGAAVMSERIGKVNFYDGKAILPASFARGCDSGKAWVTVKYRRKPQKLTEDTLEANAELDISPDAAFLMPYLTASLLLADEEPELSELYLGFYEKYSEKLLSRHKNGVGSLSVMPWLSEGEML